jgi:diguanylate cyclase (GGDEF)-like protein
MNQPLFSADLFRSRFARRLLGLFVACALLPTIALALVVFTYARGELEEQSRRRLHHTSKTIGLGIHERLLFLGTQLQAVASPPPGRGSRRPALRPELVSHLRVRFLSLAVATAEGRGRSLFGEGLEIPELGPRQREHLAAGRVVLATAHRGDAPPAVVMVVAAGAATRLVAQVDTAYLSQAALEATEGEDRDFCVFDPLGVAIACSRPGRLAPPDVVIETDRRASGHFEWASGEETYLSHYWSLFLKPTFASAPWTVVVAEPSSEVFASIARFTTSFVLIGVASLLVVLLLSIGQIRRSLVPLRRLWKGTLRIAAQDFETRVDVRSGDEFEELAGAFNAMAERLGRQFSALATRSQLDRAILSATDMRSIVDTILERVPNLCPCDAVCVILLDTASATTARSYVANTGPSRRLQRDELLFDLESINTLEANDEILVSVEDAPTPAYLKALTLRGMRSILVLPVRFEGELAAVIALGREDDGDDVWEDRLHVRQLADQVAVALSNAHMLDRIRFLAYHDPLTALPNRRRFKEYLAQALEQSRRHGSLLAVIFVDLDDFKRINDTLGHNVGDELLRAVARRVSGRLIRSPGGADPRAGAQALARLGGDEFTLLAPHLENVDAAAALADKLLECLARPFGLGSHEAFVSGSVGIAMYPFDGDEAGVLLRNADTAMHHAKELGKNRFQFYTRSMNEAALERLTLEARLHRALEREEFELHFQPIFDLASGRLAAAEALVRWRHPERGLVLPGEFIPVAEDLGLIVPLGDWILRSVCRTCRAWQRASGAEIPVAINLSARQFREEKLVESIRSATSEAGLDPRLLGLEITESILMAADERNIETLRILRAQGILVALDDFGTGYSSLSYLKHFPVDSLKIDRSFVRDVAVDEDDAAITRAVIAMGHSLKLRVVAEGVERQEQLEFLRRHGCDAVQGTLLGQPVPAAQFAAAFLDGTLA